MKKILIVSPCGKRRNTIGLIGILLSSLEGIDKTKYQISLFDTNFFERSHNPKDYKVEAYYRLENHWYDDVIRRVPRLRVKFANRQIVNRYNHIIRKDHFDMILVYKIPEYADELVRLAHENGSKVFFYPFGSDILRASEKVRKRLKKAFSEVDGVCGYDKSGTINAARDVYSVPQEKLRIQYLYLEGIKRIISIRGTKTRKEMMGDIRLPYSKFNIVCGYSGRESHRHSLIIESLNKVKDVLPEGYQIVFPMTYGAGNHHELVVDYAARLKEKCDTYGLNTVFLTSFMTDDQVAYLHLVTDLFIEIQPTDNGNAFFIEALFAENKIVTGRWLKYKNFEQFGDPYYLIDTPEELAEMLRNIFTHRVPDITVPKELIAYYLPTEEKRPHVFWNNLFENL